VIETGTKTALTSIALIILIASLTFAAATVISEYFHPQIKYEIGATPLIVAYETIPLDFEYLIKNSNYTFPEYMLASTPAIQVKKMGNVTLNFDSINMTHFTEFKVEVWNLTATPDTLIGSFDLSNIPLTFSSGIANYGYSFYFTTADVTATGTVTLEVLFQGES
jgi:hypothetical protein